MPYLYSLLLEISLLFLTPIYSTTQCSNGTFNVDIVFMTDVQIETHSWNIRNSTSSTIVQTKSLSEQNTLYEDSFCLEDGFYDIEIINSFHNGLDEGGRFQVSINNNETIILKAEGYRNYGTIQATFGVCSRNDECLFQKDECSLSTCDLSTRQCLKTPTFSKQCRTYGTPSVLALRVVAQDASTTSSADEISNALFGTFGKNFTMSSQFNACSNDRFTMQPFVGMTETSVLIENGVYELDIAMNVVNAATSDVADFALEEAFSIFGDLEKQFDFVLLCLPPGTKIGGSTNWKAYAFINSYKSIYNDENCIYPSVLLHEIGHNLGLSHSNDHENYGDKSGMMGLSSVALTGPSKCFNAPKLWQLGWYKESHYLVDSKISPDFIIIELLSIVDFKQRLSEPTNIKIINGNDGFDYYISYNRAAGINLETEEGKDMVLLSKRESGIDYADSMLLAKLESGFSYTILSFDHQLNLVLSVVLHPTVTPPYATILLTKETGLAGSCSDNSDCEDYNSCTIDSCAFFACSFTEKICSECGALVSVTTTTNEYPQGLYWTIENTQTSKIVRSSGYFTLPSTIKENTKCLEYGKYMFSLSYVKSDLTNTTTNTSFSVSIGENIISQDDFHTDMLSETVFTICNTDQLCLDYNGCTLDTCNLETNLCNNTLIQNEDDCLHCSWFALSLNMDNFPEETSWKLYNHETSDYVLAGNPYGLFAVGFGRRKAPTKAGRRKAPTRANFFHRGLSDSDNVINERICLEKQYTYHYIIKDSFGDGICCSEGQGSYSTTINDEVILAGGDFEEKQEISFISQNCSTDTDCDDGNFCTLDTCYASISTCTYRQRPCSECGATVTVSLVTDKFPHQTCWNITNDRHEKVMSEGPFLNAGHLYEQTQCLARGNYVFSLLDKGIFLSEGIHLCVDGNSSSCGFSIFINDELLVKSSEVGLFSSYQKSFEIVATLITPSLTDAPTEDWILEYHKAFSTVNNTDILEGGLTLQYFVSKGKLPEQISPNILERNCFLPFEENPEAIMIANKTFEIDEDSEMDKSFVTIKFNSSNIREGQAWTGTTDNGGESGSITFCVRTELLFREENTAGPAITFSDTVITIDINFDADFASVQQFSLEKHDASHIEKAGSMHIDACLCQVLTADTVVCDDEAHPSLTQNSLMKLCVFPPANMQISSFNELIMFQDGVAKFIAIESGVTKLATEAKTIGDVGLVKTQVPATFFEMLHPSNAVVTGKVILDFKNSRYLYEAKSLDVLSSEAASFQISINLTKGSPILSIRELGIISLMTILLVIVSIKKFRRRENKKYTLLESLEK